MTEQAQGQPTPEAPQSNNGGGFTQEDVNKIAGTRAKEAKQAAINDILSKTGVESLDDVFSYVEEYRALEEATATEADKANERAEKFEAQFKQEREARLNATRTWAFRDALRDSGINGGRIPGALRLADLDNLEVDGDGNVTGIEEELEKVREASPEWWPESQEPRRTITSPQATREATPQGNTYEGGIASHIFRTLNSGP
jgi:hypothetical protein